MDVDSILDETAKDIVWNIRFDAVNLGYSAQLTEEISLACVINDALQLRFERGNMFRIFTQETEVRRALFNSQECNEVNP